MFGKDKRDALKQAQAVEYATRRDFQEIFIEDMDALHTLAFLLTADQAKAEQCFVAGLEESIEGNPVFRQWARSWSKRVIIRNAIKLIAPTPGEPSEIPANLFVQETASEKDTWINLVLELPAFERFAFVISVLEGHSLSDCATMLGCTNTQLAQARADALEHIGLALGATAEKPQSRSTTSLRFITRLGLA